MYVQIAHTPNNTYLATVKEGHENLVLMFSTPALQQHPGYVGLKTSSWKNTVHDISMYTLPLTWYQIHKNFHHLLGEFCIPLGEFAGGKRYERSKQKEGGREGERERERERGREGADKRH